MPRLLETLEARAVAKAEKDRERGEQRERRGVEGIFSPKMRPFVKTASVLTTAMNTSCGMIDCSTEPFQTNSILSQFCCGRTIMVFSRLQGMHQTARRRPMRNGPRVAGRCR